MGIVIKKPFSILVDKTLGEVWEDIKNATILSRDKENVLLELHSYLPIIYWDSEERDWVIRDCIKVRFKYQTEDSLLFLYEEEWKKIIAEYKMRHGL